MNELTKKYPNFDKDREAIQKETGGGEGKIYKLVEKYPELKPYEETLLEINYAHAPDLQVIEWLKGIKAKGYTVYMFDNVAPDTLKTGRCRTQKFSNI